MRTRRFIHACAAAAVTLIGASWWPTPQVSAAGEIAPGGRECFDVAGDPGDIAVVNLTPVQARGAGNGQLVSSDIANPPTASNVNFAPGTVDPNVAMAPIGGNGRVCYVNSRHTPVHLVADHLATIRSSAVILARSSGSPLRVVDTRQSGGKIAPSSRRCFTVAGQPDDVAVVNLTPVQAEGGGNGQLISSNITSPPTASNVNFRQGTTDPNVALAPIGDDGRICFVNSQHTRVHLVADHLATLASDAVTLARSSGASLRALDTRSDGKIGPSSRRCFAVAGNPADVAVVNLTPVGAEGGGNGQLLPSDVSQPGTASNVNFNVGTADPNVAFTPIGSDNRVCFHNSNHTRVHLVADHLAPINADVITTATNTGAPLRVLDTRPPAPPPSSTTSTTTTTTTTTTTVPTANCHPSYPTVCIPPPPPDLNCGDVPYRNFTVVPPDPHNFDGNQDGIGCVG